MSLKKCRDRRKILALGLKIFFCKSRWCLIDLDLYTDRWYATYVNQLSQLDVSLTCIPVKFEALEKCLPFQREPNWTAITQACVDTKVESKLECLKVKCLF